MLNPCRRNGLIVACTALLLDQLHKWIMLDIVGIAERPAIELLPFFNLVMVWNYGISFGMFSGHDGDGAIYLTLLALVITAVLLVWLWRAADMFVCVALGLIIGGSLGNVIDRQRFGAVADFFDFHIAGWHYPAFNIADSCIFIGVMLLLWDSFFRSGGAKKTGAKDAS